MNLRPLGYEPNELPGCSTPHFDSNNLCGFRQMREALRSRMNGGANRIRELLLLLLRLCLGMTDRRFLRFLHQHRPFVRNRQVFVQRGGHG